MTDAASSQDQRQGILSQSFLGLLVTQFLGATNDNLFRWLVVPIGVHYVGEARASLALSAGLACFVVPYVLLAAPAGYLADRFSKRTVIVGCKVAEVVLMLLGVGAIQAGNPNLLFSVVALMGAQSALFGPAKLGSIPEMLRPERISVANGLIGLTTVLAIIVGTVGGYALYGRTGPDGRNGLGISAAVLLGVALGGWLASLRIARLPAANPRLPWPANPLGQTIRDLRTLAARGPLLRVALGSAFFWSLGSLAQVNVDTFGVTELHLAREKIGPLLAVLALGVGAGSVLAGIWSRGRVELGLVPLAATGIALTSAALCTVPPADGVALGPAYAWTCVWLLLLGISAGLFDVPLASYLQHRSPGESRGAVLAASNFLTFTGMLLVAGMFAVLRAPRGAEQLPLVSARGIFLLAGCLTVPVAIYALVLLPQATIRFVTWLLSGTIYRVRVAGRENLPGTGGALLAPNHVSWIDGVLLLLTSSRPIRMLAYADYTQGRWRSWLARTMGVIPIKPGQRRSVVEALREAKESLRGGELVCIFPEGALTRTGQLQAFQPGVLSLARDTGVPVVPVYLDGLWGSIFSYHGGKCFWKRPRQWPYPVSIRFGRPLAQVDDIHVLRRTVQDLEVTAVKERQARKLILPRVMVRMCRRAMFRSKVADSLGTDLTGGTLLMRMLIVRRLLLRHVLQPEEKYVGLLLPPSAGAVVVNGALPLLGRVAVNLNYTVAPDVMNNCIHQAGIRHVLTTRKVMEKFQFDLDAQVVYLDDLRDKVTLADKLAAGLMAYACPAWLTERLLGLTKIRDDDLLTVIFTSGSTGEPKGVMLSYRNVGSNVDAIDQIIQLNKSDVLLGTLPFFHSLGYTTTMWTVLALEIKGAYHFSPLEAQQVGKLAGKHRATILITTPTFLRSYLKRCPPEDFAALDVAVAGAEKLPKDVCDAFEARFGVRPVEGYGTTELSPLVSVNIPPSRAPDTSQVVAKEGTVGRPVPGVAAKILHPETGQELGIEQPGLLWVTGPNVMQGYLHQPEKTAEVIRDGWYNTGDIAVIDADGFIRITGRESRFSKIGGEMVPHIKIEETIQAIVGAGEDEVKAVVTAVPDPRKGERLVVVHVPIHKTPDAISKELSEAGLPNLWIPSPDSYLQVDAIPLLGSGKLDLKAIKALALERMGVMA